jgi:hypothetical protein
MNPQPLVRVPARMFLDYLCEPRRVQNHFFLEVARSDQRNFWLKAKLVLT